MWRKSNLLSVQDFFAIDLFLMKALTTVMVKWLIS